MEVHLPFKYNHSLPLTVFFQIKKPRWHARLLLLHGRSYSSPNAIDLCNTHVCVRLLLPSTSPSETVQLNGGGGGSELIQPHKEPHQPQDEKLWEVERGMKLTKNNNKNAGIGHKKADSERDTWMGKWAVAVDLEESDFLCCTESHHTLLYFSSLQ